MKGLRFESPIFFSTGEPSGDVYAALFIRELRKKFPEAAILGVGDGNMRNSGAEIVLGYEQLMAFGLSDSLSSLFLQYSFYRKIARSMLIAKPTTFVAVAYPGVNMLLCRIAKRHGMKVYYMLPPQIWAWGGFRRRLLKKWVDVVISVLPFEADFYRRLGFDTMLIDNPLVHTLGRYTRKDRHERIGFMPGSRRSHVARNLPVVLYLARFIRNRRPDIDLCLIAFDAEHARDLADRQNVLRVVHRDRHQIMKDCDLLFVSSGTASLEAATMGIPQIFFHNLSFLDDHILRKFITIREFNLANLYYGKSVVPCYITSNGKRLRQSLSDTVRPYL